MGISCHATEYTSYSKGITSTAQRITLADGLPSRVQGGLEGGQSGNHLPRDPRHAILRIFHVLHSFLRF